MKTNLIAATVMCAVTALAGDIKKDIIGKWDDPETGQTTEFKVDHALEQTLPNGQVMRGKYSFLDDTLLMIMLDSELMPISPVMTPVTIDGDDLQFVDSDGKKVKKLKRKKDDTKETP